MGYCAEMDVVGWTVTWKFRGLLTGLKIANYAPGPGTPLKPSLYHGQSIRSGPPVVSGLIGFLNRPCPKYRCAGGGL